jgi:membrane protein DedA with SNARE-associated domain
MVPVVRHLISLPAGLLKMPLATFSMATLSGSALWCTILAWFGNKVIGDQPELLQNPHVLVDVMKDKLLYIVLAILVMGGLYALIRYRISHTRKGASHG